MITTDIRVNKYLANLGICSRRDAADILKKQKLTVNGKQIRKPGVHINPLTDDIQLNGKKLQQPTLVYYMLNKPKEVISTTADEHGRKNVTSFIPTKQRMYPVGRLDKDTTGLILLTNDGTVTNLLTHPSYHIPKRYVLTIIGKVTPRQQRMLAEGVPLTDGMTAPAQVQIRKETPRQTILEITIHEGRNRQIRRMCETLHINLQELQRIAIGPLQLGNIKEGQYRELTQQEITLLKEEATIQGKKKKDTSFAYNHKLSSRPASIKKKV